MLWHAKEVMMAQMEQADLDGVELEYGIQGAGEPVILIQSGHFADWFAPLLDQSTLTDHYRLVRYHRAGCAGSSHIAGAVSLAQQFRSLPVADGLPGNPAGAVVGHSSSGNIALQLALDAPGAVHSLAILEPALMSLPSAPTSRVFVGIAVQLHRVGDKAGAIDTFLRGVCGPDYRPVPDQALPGAFEQHVADADTFFGQELPALLGKVSHEVLTKSHVPYHTCGGW
jgi:pimeloyl-ACP methyl ester carboxylesterase